MLSRIRPALSRPTRKKTVHEMDKLASYLFEHIQLDFSNVEFDRILQLLKEDRNAVSTQLLTKLIEEKGEEELLVVLADCLKDDIGRGIDLESIKKQLALYAEA